MVVQQIDLGFSVEIYVLGYMNLKQLVLKDICMSISP